MANHVPLISMSFFLRNNLFLIYALVPYADVVIKESCLDKSRSEGVIQRNRDNHRQNRIHECGKALKLGKNSGRLGVNA